MENPNIADSHPITNEMQVNLHMLRLLMLKRVGGEIHGADVVAVDECSWRAGSEAQPRAVRAGPPQPRR
jgi:hypothetical protein